MNHTTLEGLAHLAALGSGLWLLHREYRWLRDHRCLVAALMGVLVSALLLRVSAPPALMQDFTDAYHAAGMAVQSGPQGLSPMIELGVHGFVNLPLVAYLFWPFGLLPQTAAMAMFSLLGIACVLVTWRLLVRMAGLDAKGAAVLLFLILANGPLLYGLKEGNTSHMILLLMVLALTWLQQGRGMIAGAALGVAAIIKPPLVLVGLYFLFRRRWNVVAGGAATIAAAVVLSVLVFGLEMHLRWYELCLKPYGEHPLAAFNVQSIQAFVLRFQTGADGLLAWDPMPLRFHLHLLSQLLVLGCAASVAIVLYRAGRPQPGNGRDWQIEFMLVLALICVISPVSWSHYYVWLLMPAAFFVAPERPLGTRRDARIAGWGALLLASAPVISTTWSPGWGITPYVQFAASGLMISGLAWMVLLAVARSGPQRPERTAST